MINAVLILGSYINAYSLIKEFSRSSFEVILGYEKISQLAYLSSIPNLKFKVPDSNRGLRVEINEIAEKYDNLVVFCTTDNLIRKIHRIKDELYSNVIHPYKQNIDLFMDKSWQYAQMDKLGVPYPKSEKFKSWKEKDVFNKLGYPVIVRPIRESVSWNVKNLVIHSDEELLDKKGLFGTCFKEGSEFLVSRYIKGDSSGNIFAYTGYYSNRYNCAVGWVGRKLAQYPNDTGVFSAAESCEENLVKEYGKLIVTELSDNYCGILEPEFKREVGTGKFYLTEINFRTMMWHGLGRDAGVNLALNYAKELCGEQYEIGYQKYNMKTIYINHELINLFRRKGYLSIFRSNLKGKTSLVNFNPEDVLPFLYDISFGLMKIILTRSWRS